MYTLFASDMDGTLLNNESKVSPETTVAIRRAEAAGKIFTVVTGRSLPALSQFLPDLPLLYPFGIYNGAMIVDREGRVYYNRPLERADARRIMKIAHKRRTKPFLWIGQDMYGYEWDEVLLEYARLSNIEPKVVRDEEEERELLLKPMEKILWYDTPERISAWLDEFRESMAGTVNVTTSAPEFIEFNHIDVTKGKCLERLAEIMEIPREEIIAAGDETNDIPMIEYAGLGIAMKNATQEMLDAADMVSPWTNDEDGLAKLIDRYLIG